MKNLLGDDYEYRLRTLVRTEAAYVHAKADLKSYEDCEIEEYEYSALLDSKTSEICNELDGKKFKISEAKPGTNYPPMHPNCRSTTVASIDKSRWDVPDDFDLKKEEADFENWMKEQVTGLKNRDFKDDIIELELKPNNKNEKEKFIELNDYFMDKYDIMIDEQVFELNYKAVSETMNGVEIVIDEFPDLADSLQYISVYPDGAMSCDGREIYFNPDIYNNYDKLLELVKYQSDIGHWVQDSDIASTGVHEAVHGVEWILSQLNPEYKLGKESYEAWGNGLEAKKIVTNALKLLREADPGNAKSDEEIFIEISEVANENYSEAMAEAFSDVYIHDKNAHPLSLKIKELSKILLKSYKEVRK